MELKNKIREEILNKLGDFVEVHPEMSICFEYNDSRRLFLISYHFDNEKSDEDSIWDEIFDLQSGFEEKFGLDAPLFCQDNRLYELSSKAEIIRCVKRDKIQEVWTLKLEDKVSPIVYSSQKGCYSDMFWDGMPEYSFAA
ncbi:MAG: hypothetical protein K2M16_09575 [Muribaculaceae bacterium]|nr:hypothetical protein [Muribaculaceae bacterium]